VALEVPVALQVLAVLVALVDLLVLAERVVLTLAREGVVIDDRSFRIFAPESLRAE